MNILFLLKSLDVGGVEIVTTMLANKFCQEGHHVVIWAFYRGVSSVEDRLYKKVHVVYGNGYEISKNVDSLRKTIIKEEIDIVVNQWALPQIPIRTLLKAQKGLNVKVISIYHNDPIQNARIQSVSTEICNTKNVVKKGLLYFKKTVYRIVTGYAMEYSYRHSNLFEVLSPSFVQHLKKYTKHYFASKIVVQTNPTTIDINNFKYNFDLKHKEIIYVGRVDYTQKRVHRVIDIWSQLEEQFPDWRLTIVGDGEERNNMERIVKERKLTRVSFEGFQQPRPYYERASILILTSEFEGFPLVLAECMSFGVVPIVYGSYSAVYDIIEDGKNGAIIKKTPEGYDASAMIERTANIMGNPQKLKSMALNAIEKSKEYSIDIIYEQWMEVLHKLKNSSI